MIGLEWIEEQIEGALAEENEAEPASGGAKRARRQSIALRQDHMQPLHMSQR